MLYMFTAIVEIDVDSSEAPDSIKAMQDWDSAERTFMLRNRLESDLTYGAFAPGIVVESCKMEELNPPGSIEEMEALFDFKL